MLFEFIKCKQCNTKMIPDYDITIESYKTEGFLSAPLVLETITLPPKIPTYIIFRCENQDCDSIERLEHEDILQEIYKGLANIAWNLYKADVQKAVTFENYVTRYVLEKGIDKFIDKEEFNNHPVIRDYLRSIKNVK